MTYSGFDIFTLIHDPGKTDTLDRAQGASSKLKTIHENISQTMVQGQTALSAFWKGQAADSGTAGLSPLIQSSQITAENLDRAQRSMQEQSSAFVYVRDNARDVPKDRANDNTPEDWLSFGASDDEKTAAKFDADTKFNVDLYEPYYQSTQPRRTTLAPDYPAAHDPNVSAGGITPAQVTPVTSGGPHSSGSGGHSSGHSGGYRPGPSTYSAPPGAAGYHAPPPPGHSTAGVNTPAANDTTSAAFAGPTQTQGGPGSSSWQGPGGVGVNGPGGGNSSGFGPGFGPVGGFGGGGGFGPGGGRGGFGPGGSGSGSGFGPGGGGASGGAAGAGRGVGAGAGTGAGAMGEGAGAARPGGMGAAGAKGQPGMGGGMGAGGAKGGKGTEDEEHQRKILLSEEDPDSIFGGYDGNKPTPPVIGA
ncbi:hypothetical protein [Amycolatopsis sp. DSM 110486]|uniref:hypothetical protein n=1 Tax=Amycolatopsis sp. DSM 110486 TaxID=2865832 RepID=UPI001C69B7D6|nr:hypothetical protein [Amycolatopsis sp. DSM 110486]QYN23955.1 hypothetical protein K1T34_16810 [Amycolatopsis sp. DSM 110486]